MSLLLEEPIFASGAGCYCVYCKLLLLSLKANPAAAAIEFEGYRGWCKLLLCLQGQAAAAKDYCFMYAAAAFASCSLSGAAIMRGCCRAILFFQALTPIIEYTKHF
ncbi:hypothetical protein OIU84_011057 [Salix udensis]|uniref:Uncharacterized protein n=1 Tax=Salix udensis TaxID=889485 RepID=A0AAD6JM72_9ROSI|nr:hypothetical protein OIU84_011057 [Salix udensis]